jgi:hypothetical protein
MDLLHFFASPGGNLLWDVLLQALGIFFTVVILQRYFAHREEMRWHPARQYLYRQLFSYANRLIGLLPNHVREGWPMAAYQFGYASHLSPRYDSAFMRSVIGLDVWLLKDAATQFADDPTLLDDLNNELDSTLGHTAAVFLAIEPELNRIISELRGWISNFEGSLEIYRRARQSGMDPARVGGSSAIEQACINLREVIIVGSQLRFWLAGRADEIRPFNPDPPA